MNPAIPAFDAVAAAFDTRFGSWLSVAAQRRAVRRILAQTLVPGCRVLEVGCGTGDDAVWLARNGFAVTATDPSPRMIEIARSKLAPFGAPAELIAAEDLDRFADRHLRVDAAFDAAFSNFAPLNCVPDLHPVASGLARLIRPGGRALLVLFGCLCPGEMITEMLRGRRHEALRRLRRREVPARIGSHQFGVTYHRSASIRTAMHPWFRPVSRFGVGIFVPPSAAEPWISNHPRLLSLLERLDRFASKPLAIFADHKLYHFERTQAPAP